MKKPVLILCVALGVLAIFIICISKTNALSCQSKYGYLLKYGKCYNSKTQISYAAKSRDYFYYKDIPCGFKCDYNGKNCQKGACFATECPKAFPQLQIFSGAKSPVWSCYNPQTHIGYYPEDLYSDKYIYYLNNKKCGENCNSDGTNCKVGFCNAKECAEGYTQIYDGDCYNPTTDISYRISFEEDYKTRTVHEKFKFYLAGKKCGENCDLDGTNCEDGGVCLLSYCNKQAGYTKILDGKCYNEKTSFFYDSKHDMYKEIDKYKNKSYCGTNCDIYTGKHCQKGACDISDCAKGYTQFNARRGCYNPISKLSYSVSPNYNYAKVFSNNGYECGINCDLDGKNCKKGICNILDCAKGYTKFESGQCINPQTKLSYKLHTANSINFYYNDHYCGYNCDYNGLNCEEGNCNPDKLKKKMSKQHSNSSLGEAAQWGLFLTGAGLGGVVVSPFIYGSEMVSNLKDKHAECITKAQKNTPNGYTMILLEKNH